MIADELFHKVWQGLSHGSNHDQWFLSEGQNELVRWCRSYGLGHPRSDLAHHGIAYQNGDWADDGVNLFDTVTNGVFSGGPTVGARFHHLGRSNGIRSESPQLDLFAEHLSDSLDNCCADTTALTIDDCDFDQEALLPNMSQ